MTWLTRLATVFARGIGVQPRALVLLLLSATVLSVAVACDDDPEVDEGLEALPTGIGTAEIPADESDAEFVYSDTSIEPTSVTLPSQGVVISLRNDGSMDHEFVLVDSEDTYEIDELPVMEGSEVALESLTVLGEVEPFPPGETRTATAELEAGKRYIVFCNVPGHYQAGVRAEIETAGE